MSYPEEIVKINPKLSDINDKVSFTFKNTNITQKFTHIIIKPKIILDVVYLKKEIHLQEKNIQINKDESSITIEIENFHLNDIEENNLMNISSLNFDFIAPETNEKIDEKILILQIIKEKEKIKKYII